MVTASPSVVGENSSLLTSAMTTRPEAFLLLAIPNASIDTPSGKVFGDLSLEYVTFPAPATSPDVLLIIRVAAFEIVLDPSQTISASILPTGEHSYRLHSPADATEHVLPLSSPGSDAQVADDIETFHGILSEYGGFHGPDTPPPYIYGDTDGKAMLEGAKPVPEEDLRGRFVLVNEDNGKIIGALDRNVRVREDLALGEKGHEHDPVVVELPDGVEDLSETEVLVRSVPPEDRGWMVKGAVVARCVLLGIRYLQSDLGVRSKPCHYWYSDFAYHRHELCIQLLYRTLHSFSSLHPGDARFWQQQQDKYPTIAPSPPAPITYNTQEPLTHPYCKRTGRQAQWQDNRPGRRRN